MLVKGLKALVSLLNCLQMAMTLPSSTQAQFRAAAMQALA